MCGIAGYVGKRSPSKLHQMLDLIEHRGKDARSTFEDDKVSLGHNRLAIIDLSPLGIQPMFNAKKDKCIIFNGEIYNFQALREELSKKYEFKSGSDTETILYSYEEWGTGCLKKLNGMFSFVIYDLKQKTLFGARDRLGEKPLKYYWDGENFAFASEIKALLPFLKKVEIDPEAINDFLTLQYIPSPKTGFKNIYKLSPASFFLFKDGKLKIGKYWSLDFSEKLNLSESEWEELLFEKIEDSVKSRLIADVPIGAFLSGGLDSSAVVALMARNTKEKIKTFNIGFEDKEFDESRYAEIVAKQYNTDHNTQIVTGKMMTDVLKDLPLYYDEPIADSSTIPTLLLSRFTRKSVKVALTGDGGDENFAGYDRYNIVNFSKYYEKLPHTLISPLTEVLRAIYPSKLTNRISVFSKTMKLPFYKRYLYYNSFFNTDEKTKLYSNKFKQLVENNDTFDLYKELYNKNLSYLDNSLSFDINTYLPEDLLYKTDTASMSINLELRSPFLNHELMELVAKMPDSLKLKSNKKKYILKNVLKKKKILPEEIIERPKRGFNAPLKNWLRGEAKNYLLDQISTTKFKDSNIFDQSKLKTYIENSLKSETGRENNLFAVLSLAGWINKYV